jgi:hypothetical protein
MFVSSDIFVSKKYKEHVESKIMYNNGIADKLSEEMNLRQKKLGVSRLPGGRDFAITFFTLVFLLFSFIALLQSRDSNSSDVSNSPLEHVLNMNTSKEAKPLWSLSSLYDHKDIREQEKDHVLNELLEKHSTFLWVEVGVFFLFGSQFSTAKIIFSPTVRMIIRQHSKSTFTASKRLFSMAGKTIRTVYKNRDKYSTLSDCTWYVNVDAKNSSEALTSNTAGRE